MKKVKAKYTFSAKVFAYSAEATSWYFVALPKEDSETIKTGSTKRVGFGYIPVEVTVGETTWRTTLFPTKEGPYLLALKKDVRIREDIHTGEMVKVRLRFV